MSTCCFHCLQCKQHLKKEKKPALNVDMLLPLSTISPLRAQRKHNMLTLDKLTQDKSSLDKLTLDKSSLDKSTLDQSKALSSTPLFYSR